MIRMVSTNPYYETIQLLGINSPDTLDNTHPAIIFQAACLNEKPEAYSLAQALLRDGAVASYAATRVSWYSKGEWSSSTTDPMNPTFLYKVMKKVVEGAPVGRALYDIAGNFSVSSRASLMNLMIYNLYGDPELSINDKGKGDKVISIQSPLHADPLPVGNKDNPVKKRIRATVKSTAGTFIANLQPCNFSVTVGSSDAPVLGSWPLTLADGTKTYELLIQPPPQAENALFDLRVNYRICSATKIDAFDLEGKAINYTDAAQSYADIVQVIDRSGSMDTDNKLASAKSAANQFINKLNEGDMIGIVSFSDTSQKDFPLTTVTADVKTQAQNAVNGISATGLTSIGAGLTDALSDLTTLGNPNHGWATVLLSDGGENVSPYASSVLPSLANNHIKVYTIGLGSDADQSILNNIANQTGGKAYYTSTDADLIEIYNLISGDVSGRETTIGLNGSVEQGKTVTHQFFMDAFTHLALLSFSWNNAGSALSLTLTRPDGSTVQSGDTGVEYLSQTNYIHIKLPIRRAGNGRSLSMGIKPAAYQKKSVQLLLRWPVKPII